MVFKIFEYIGNYGIYIISEMADLPYKVYNDDIQTHLNINRNDFYKIMLSSGAKRRGCQDKYYFPTYESAEIAILKLEPYLIMATLIGE